MYNHNFIYSKIRFYSKIIIFVYLFIYLSNADVENCGEVKGFGFIYIYRLEFGKRTEVHVKLKIENKVIRSW